MHKNILRKTQKPLGSFLKKLPLITFIIYRGKKMEGKYRINNEQYRATVEWYLKDGRFSASGIIDENNRGRWRDYSAGQCLDEILEIFPNDELIQRIHKVWKKWHLNDMHPGTPNQEAYLAKFEQPRSDHYSWAKEKLAEAGLDPDPNYEYNGKPYSYGSAWLNVELPRAIEEEILSWQGNINKS